MARLLLLAFILLCFFGGGAPEENEEKLNCSPSVLEDIAYDTNASHGYRVYIAENGIFTPYLVLTRNYNDNCLLLREHLLDDDQIYNNVGEKAAYYENSSIDHYLNEDYLNTLSVDVQDSIVKSTIEITKKESLGIGGKETKTIDRYVFLLSFTELNAGGSRTNLKEGNELLYFSDKTHRIGTYKDNIPGSWWLRTPNTSGRTIVCGVSKEGVVGIGGIYNPNNQGGYYNGVRPAFCLTPDEEIELIEWEGDKIYVLK
ncbi:MAG: DUF6273 domain-containing protein [Eubacteriaceae bacterium]|nr:DUF6273 domain-containing protein [Eubacteriaceae bacterium]